MSTEWVRKSRSPENLLNLTANAVDHFWTYLMLTVRLQALSKRLLFIMWNVGCWNSEVGTQKLEIGNWEIGTVHNTFVLTNLEKKPR